VQAADFVITMGWRRLPDLLGAPLHDVWRDEQDVGKVRGVEGYASLVDQYRVG
jgi:hypothetical protein